MQNFALLNYTTLISGVKIQVALYQMFTPLKIGISILQQSKIVYPYIVNETNLPTTCYNTTTLKLRVHFLPPTE